MNRKKRAQNSQVTESELLTFNETFTEGSRILKEKSSIDGALVSFFDKDMNFLRRFPVLTINIENKARATMLIINALMKENKDFHYCQLSSGAKNLHTGEKYLISNFEGKEDPDTTIDTLFIVEDRKLIEATHQQYVDMAGDKPFISMPFYGFFDDPEFNVPKKTRTRMDTLSKILFSDTQKRTSVNDDVLNESLMIMNSLYNEAYNIFNKKGAR